MNGYIELITGNLGGGKTLYAIEKAVDHVLRGGYFFGNIKLKLDSWEKYAAARGYVLDLSRIRVFQDSEMEEFYKHVGRGTHDSPVMVVYDEAALGNLNARDWQKLERDMLNFNALTRKLDIILLYISQDAAFVDKQVRKLCQRQTDCRSLKDFRLFGGLIPCPIPFRIRVYHTLRGGVPVKDYGELLAPRPDLYPLYDSDALLGRSVEKFCSLGVLNGGPLARVQRAESLMVYSVVSSLCAALYTFF